jgi:hypothetical protein
MRRTKPRSRNAALRSGGFAHAGFTESCRAVRSARSGKAGIGRGRLRARAEFSSDFRLIWAVQTGIEKYFALPEFWFAVRSSQPVPP